MLQNGGIEVFFSGHGRTAVIGTKTRAPELPSAGTLTSSSWDGPTAVVGTNVRALAAKGEHLDVLMWARSNGCPWEEFACSFAAGNGHVGVLQ